MSLVLVVGSVTVAAIANKDAVKQLMTPSQQPSPLQVIENKTMVHARVHQSIDLRATVVAVAIITIAGQTLKDGRTLFLDWLMGTIGVLSLLGIICVVIATFVSLRNMRHAESVDEIIRRAMSEEPMREAATQLHSMQKITRRKSIAANLALIIMAVDFGFFCFGLM